jgi:multidrug resistance efflux pump
VHVETLRYVALLTPVEVSGSLVAGRSVTVGATSAGRVVAVDVREGDAVHAGQVIAQIDPAAYAAGVAQAQAGLAAAGASANAASSVVAAASANGAEARARLAAAAVKEKLAVTTAARMTSLYSQGAISQQQNDETNEALAAARAATAQAQAGLQAAQSDLAAARARLASSSASADQARAGIAVAGITLRDATVVAPFDGVVTTKFVEAGAVVGAGSPIAAMQDAGALEADVSVPNDLVSALSPGDRVAVYVDAAGGATLTGRVRAIVPAQDPSLRSATVKIAVAGAPRLLSGMYVRVRFERRTPAVWAAPLAALVTRGGQTGVFAVRAGTASFLPLQTGTVSRGYVELIGYPGPAAEVAVSAIQAIDDGSRVTIER